MEYSKRARNNYTTGGGDGDTANEPVRMGNECICVAATKP